MATNLKKLNRGPSVIPCKGEPTWEIARLFPAQGEWSEEEYFALDSNHFIEYSDGFLEFLPIPTIFHQLILQFIFKNLDRFVTAQGLGTVVITGYKVRIRGGKYREPDILFIKTAHQSGIKKQYCDKVDLVVEIVSEKNRPHDIEVKRVEYAKAGIPEYWIVDPEEEMITVLALRSRQKTYIEFGVFRKGSRAGSKVLPGFTIDVRVALGQKP